MKKTSDATLGMHILELEITSRCNLNCLHCYNRPKKNYDLPVKEFKKFFNFSKKYNVSNFIVSGGEARMHPEFDKICSFIKKRDKKGPRLVLQTNGTMIDEEFFKVASLFDVIHVSFDLDNLVRKDSLSNLYLAKKLISKGIKSYLFTTLHINNYKKVNNIVNLANKNKVPIGFNVCLPTEKQDDRFSIPLDDFLSLEKKLFKLSNDGKILRYSSPLTAVFDPLKGGEYKGNMGGCVAGIASCVVGFNGDVFPCPFFRVSAGNIFKDSLLKIWKKSELFNLMRDRSKYKEPCGFCDYLSYCGGCRNRALKLKGDVLAADPFCHLISKNKS